MTTGIITLADNWHYHFSHRTRQVSHAGVLPLAVDSLLSSWMPGKSERWERVFWGKWRGL